MPGGVGTASGAVRSVTGSHPGPRPRHSPGSPPTPKPAGGESPGEGGGRGDRDVTPLARAVPAPYLAWEVFQQLLETRALQQQRWVSVQPPSSPEGPRVSPRIGDTAVPSPVPTAWDTLGLGPLVPARWGPSPPIVPLAGSRHRWGTVTAGWGHAVGPQRCPGSLGVGQHPAGHCSPKSQPKGSQPGGDRGGSESPASPRCPFLPSTLHRPLCGTLSAEPTSTTHQHQGHQHQGHQLRGHQLRGHLW